MNSFFHGDRSNRILGHQFVAGMTAYVISSLTSSIGSLIDGVVIGQFLGLDAMAAFGLVNPVVIVFALIGAVLAAGARNRFTMKIGSGDVAGARGIYTLSMILSTGTSVLMMLAVMAFVNPICVLLGASGSAAGLLEQARGYLLGLAVGLPAMNASRVLHNYMAIDNDRQLTIISSLVLTMVDIALDVLIAAAGGGTFGMGLATSISHYAALGVLLTHFRRKERLIRFSMKDVQWKEARAILSKGLPNGVGRMSNTARSIILNQMLAATATAGCIAAYSVHRQADSLLNPFVFGIADTVTTLTGILVGEENRPMLKQLIKDNFAVAGTVTLVIGVLFWFLCPAFAAFFIKDDPEALAYGIRAARCYAVGLPLYAMNWSFIGYLEGRGKAKIVMLLNFLIEGAYLVLPAAVLLPTLQADAVWYAFPACQVLLLVSFFGILLYMNRREKNRPAGFWEWLLALPADFDVPEEDRIDRSISSHDEVIALSRAAWEFCDAHGCNNKRKHAIALAVEELATHTVVNRFRPNHSNTIDMRILKKGDEYIVRMRDDCEIFDPLKQLQLYDQHVPMHHIGLQMAIGSAKDVQYTTMLKLNNLVLRV